MSPRDTERRRLVQPLWTALDRHLRPVASTGVVIALSGGPDSRALLEALARWESREEGPLFVASVAHGVRATAREEAAAIIARAHALGFEGLVVEVRPPGTGEAQLRHVRYEALFRLAHRRGLARICTAHHADDDAEGFMLDVLGQGGGRHGAAMPVDDGRVVRPLLGLPRSALALARTALQAFDVVIDPDDARGHGARARLREAVLPALRSARHDVTARLAQRARRAREDEDALDALAAAVLVVDDDGLWFPTSTPRALARRAVHRAIARLAPQADPRGAGRTVDALLQALDAREVKAFDLPGVRASVVGGRVVLVRREPGSTDCRPMTGTNRLPRDGAGRMMQDAALVPLDHCRSAEDA